VNVLWILCRLFFMLVSFLCLFSCLPYIRFSGIADGNVLGVIELA